MLRTRDTPSNAAATCGVARTRELFALAGVDGVTIVEDPTGAVTTGPAS